MNCVKGNFEKICFKIFYCELLILKHYFREYSRDFDLKKHQVSHKNFLVDNQINVCPICKEGFTRHNVLLRHMGK